MTKTTIIESVNTEDHLQPPPFEIMVDTEYLDHQSNPDDNRFVFSYTIHIINKGKASAQLLRRHWIITDADGKVQEVKGDGVVGEQPHLKPGDGFRYTSGAILETPVGSMYGTYNMIADDGNEFIADIQPFTLSMPNTIH